MTASPRRRVHETGAGWPGALLLLCLATGACATPSAPPVASPIEPLPSIGARVPDEADRAARDVAVAVLSNEPEVARQEHERLETLDEASRRETGLPTGLVAASQDLLNATHDDPIAYRAASRTLLERDDLSPTLRHRLEDEVADDPLVLANDRLSDSRRKSIAQVFNAIAAPIGRSMGVGIRAAVGLARSLVALAVAKHQEEELDVPERQALGHWKRFLDEYPDAPEAPEIALRVEDSQARWNKTRRDRAVKGAKKALEHDRPAAALILAERALDYAPEDPKATRLLKQAAAQLELQRAERARSLEVEIVAGSNADPALVRDLAVALLSPDGDIELSAQRLLEVEPNGLYSDEAQYALTVALHEAGSERASWNALETLANEDPVTSNMSRHAAALVYDPNQNPYGAFEAARSQDRRDRAGWILFGPLARGPRDRDLPEGLEWLIDLPSFVEALLSFPNRLVRYPMLEPWPFGRVPAVYARRYLEQYPNGEYARDVEGWLFKFEMDRGNRVAAYRLAEANPDQHPRELASLREGAADQALEAALREPQRDMHALLLRQVATEFPDTQSGRQSGERARKVHEEATSQRIRISRGYLTENLELAGPDGIGLRPEYLDGDLLNGELHEEGVTLAGARVLEFAFVDEDEDRPPVTRRRRVSAERLARIVALLDETATQKAILDPDETLAPDADRDLYFERARLGVSETPDARPSAQSTYAYRGMRERYGLVRSRESILPFDLVLQGSLSDLSMGAFPRLRTPKATPDAILYR